MERECFDIQKVEAFLSFIQPWEKGDSAAFTIRIYHFVSCILMFGQTFHQLSTHLHTILVGAANYINVCIATLHLHRKRTHFDCDSIQNWNIMLMGLSRQHCRLTICIELIELTNSETAGNPPRRGCKIFEESQLTRKWTLLTCLGKLAPLYIYNSEWDGFWGSKFAIEMLGRPFLSLFTK